jgi:crotonobetainyl-CoA:carnitine CoA-transferase CaiB-like acyl-CoA transferase
MAGGIFSAFSIIGALLSREFGQGGEYIDLSMTEAVMSFSQIISSSVFYGDNPRPGETLLTGEVPWYDVYETADGRYVTLAAIEPKFWKAFCNEIGREDLLDAQESDDTEYLENVREELANIFSEKTQAEWEDELGEKDVMFGLVRTPCEMIEDPQVSARDIVKESEKMLSRISNPVTDSDAASESIPDMGEHTEVILKEAGYDLNQIETFREDGVI